MQGNNRAAAASLETAVEKVLDLGYRTGDIFSEGMTLVGCQAMGQAILKVLES